MSKAQQAISSVGQTFTTAMGAVVSDGTGNWKHA